MLVQQSNNFIFRSIQHVIDGPRPTQAADVIQAFQNTDVPVRWTRADERLFVMRSSLFN